MRTILLDSDVIIANFRNEQPVVRLLDQLVEQQITLSVSPIAYAEVWAGKRPGEEEAIETFFRSVSCFPIDEAVGKKAGDYVRQYGRSSGVKIADALVAAVAHCHGAELFTLNRKHYPMKDITLVQGGKS